MNSENFIYFVKAFRDYEWAKENHPEVIKDSYGNDEYTDEINKTDGQALRFRSNINSGINDARIFEVDDDVKKLLCLTTTPIKNDEIKLPFRTIFVDIKFTREELADLGIEIKADEIIGMLVKEGILVNDGKIYGKDLNLCMLTKQEGDVWFDTFNKNCNINEEYKDFNLKIIENETTDAKARDFVHKFFLNFLNFMNNPEVEYVEHIRSAKNRERRAKTGKPIIPSSFTIRVSGKLREYIDEARRGEGWTYGYRFWVRGHFRDLKSERYINKKRIWILPFIKGKGVLVEKSYKVISS